MAAQTGMVPEEDSNFLIFVFFIIEFEGFPALSYQQKYQQICSAAYHESPWLSRHSYASIVFGMFAARKLT